MFVAGMDGCRAGWVAFKVEVPSLTTSVDVVDMPVTQFVGASGYDRYWAKCVGRNHSRHNSS